MATASFDELARAHWTPQRVAQITSGRKYEIVPPQDSLFMQVTGLLENDARMGAGAQRKYAQINHMLELLKPSLQDLRARHKQLALLDAGCGSSWLTMLLAWYLKHKNPGEFLVVGIDTRKDLVEKSQKMAEKLGLSDHMLFFEASTASFKWEDSVASLPTWQAFKRPQMVVSLHACDTATDEALGLGLAAGADVLASSPCCQAELAGKWRVLAQSPEGRRHPFSPAFQAPELRRTIAAEMTDMLRVLLLRASGYETTTTEFVESRHSPKNRLIMAIRRGRYSKDSAQEYIDMKAHVGGCGIRLEEMLSVEVAALTTGNHSQKK
ncbi:MAG: hypothetical protein RIQ81_257 [Pseudomonadota bacterium]